MNELILEKFRWRLSDNAVVNNQTISNEVVEPCRFYEIDGVKVGAPVSENSSMTDTYCFLCHFRILIVD